MSQHELEDEFDRLIREDKPPDRFRVMTVAEFLNRGPPLGSREHKRLIAAEERAKDKREAAAQRRRDDYQALRERMTPLEQAYDDLELFCEMNEGPSKLGPNWNIRRAIAETLRLIEELDK